MSVNPKTKVTTKKKTKKPPLKRRGKRATPKRKKVAENMTNEYLDRQAQKLRDVMEFVNYNDPAQERYGMKLIDRQMKALEKKK